MSQDRRSGSFGYRRRSKSMERKDSVRRRSLDNEANDESSLTVEKGRTFRPSDMLAIFYLFQMVTTCRCALKNTIYCLLNTLKIVSLFLCLIAYLCFPTVKNIRLEPT